jgi:acetyl-CoA C-acetyltransferase
MPGTRRNLDPRLPVVVGLGAVDDSAPASDLMERAARAAADDAGAPGLLASLDRISVPQGSWSLDDAARSLAVRVGSPQARAVRYEIGVSQQEMLNHALAEIASGASECVLVVGGEDRAWARAQTKAGIDAEVHARTDAGTGASPGAGSAGDERVARAMVAAARGPAPGSPDEIVTRPPDFVAPIEIAAGIALPPVQQYALIENALGAAEGLGPESHAGDIAGLWARFNDVARRNPDAAFGQPRTADELRRTGPRNRLLAFPYNRWHASQWTVDQASALLICGVGRARRAGIASDRWLFPHAAVHSSSAVTLTARRQLQAWPAMSVLGRAAESRIGRPLRSLELAEVYSCFPAAVRVQQRELGLDLSGTPTVTGGMAFAGGPFNHYVLLSTVAVGRLLRERPDELGLVTTVSGMLSKPGLAVWSARPPARDRDGLVADLATEAAAATDRVPVAEVPPSDAEAVVVSFTVTPGSGTSGSGTSGSDAVQPLRTAVVADLPDGVRTAATCEDADIARLALAEGLIGRPIHVKDTRFSL